jgi:starch synthase
MTVKNNLKILFASSEVSPFAKTGGLADVAASLPKSIAVLGNDIRVVMPRFKIIKSSMDYVADFPVQVGERNVTCVIKKKDIEINGNEDAKVLPVYFVENYYYFDRDGIYCHIDDGERFAFFCKAILEMLPRINFQPDVIHCNDWHTGPTCMLLNEKYREYPFYSNIATIFTIHNLEYQGNFSKDILNFMGLGNELFVPEKVEFYGAFNFMKTGLVYSDIINAVSRNYAEEIKTPQYGGRLDGLLRKRSKDLYGVVNGISYEEYNPSTDKRIYRNYSIQNPDVKKENKYSLQKELGLPVSDAPIISLISRLTDQKGLNLITDVIDEFLELDLQFVLLGEGDQYYENLFKELKEKYPDKMGLYIGFNASLAQRIYAGSDMFLMPSRFEPCGLGQLISLRYGTIPVVRATGGLAETIIDIDYDTDNGNGFSFKEFIPAELLNAVKRAMRMYCEYPKQWEILKKRALESDFSWNKSAHRYMELYNIAIEKHKI